MKSKKCWCIITHHALEQYISRWAPNKNSTKAKKDLIELLNSSKLQSKTAMRDAIYISGLRPEIRMVIKDRNVCVTVLPDANAHYEQDEFDLRVENELEERELAQFQIDNLIKDADDLKDKLLELKEQHRKLTKSIFETDIMTKEAQALENKLNDVEVLRQELINSRRALLNKVENLRQKFGIKG